MTNPPHGSHHYSTTDFDDLVVPDLHSPELNLLAAIVQRALTDYLDPATRQHVRKSARIWLFSSSEEPFSLRWIAVHLSADPDGFRRKVLLVAHGQHRMKAILNRVNTR